MDKTLLLLQLLILFQLYDRLWRYFVYLLSDQ
jgi:hypothetical protein